MLLSRTMKVFFNSINMSVYWSFAHMFAIPSDFGSERREKTERASKESFVWGLEIFRPTVCVCVCVCSFFFLCMCSLSNCFFFTFVSLRWISFFGCFFSINCMHCVKFTHRCMQHPLLWSLFSNLDFFRDYLMCAASKIFPSSLWGH